MWKWVMNSYWIMGQQICFGRPHGVACQRVTPTLRDRILLRKKAAGQNRKKWFEKCLAKVEGHVCCWLLGNIWCSWCFVMTLQFEMEMESLKLDKCNHIAHLHPAHSWSWDAARTNPDKASWFAKHFFGCLRAWLEQPHRPMKLLVCNTYIKNLCCPNPNAKVKNALANLGREAQGRSERNPVHESSKVDHFWLTGPRLCWPLALLSDWEFWFLPFFRNLLAPKQNTVQNDCRLPRVGVTEPVFWHQKHLKNWKCLEMLGSKMILSIFWGGKGPAYSQAFRSPF